MTREGDHSFTFKDQKLILTPEKALFWNDKNALILSDVHLGKSGHFRKSGIAIPSSVNDVNLEQLDILIRHFKPELILFLGDLFHSDINIEWEAFRKWRRKYLDIKMHLVIGNHDFHEPDEYKSLGLICSKSIEAPPFILLHDSKDLTSDNNLYSISGHVHPSIRLKGKGRQSIRIPCFFFGNSYALLPAFGSLTGTHSIKPEKSELVFGIVNDQIIKIS